MQRPRGYFEQLLAARLWIVPEASLLSETTAIPEAPAIAAPESPLAYELALLTGAQVRAMRTARGWSQRKLSTLSGLSQGLISMIENDERTISLENEASLRQVFQSHS
jgi:ribosome-binding protein aMBF1 (putative translation factor)